jgi:hypothetical protein
MIVAEGTGAPAKLLDSQFVACASRRHSLNKSINIMSEILAPFFGQERGDEAPPVFDRIPRFYQFAFAGFGASAPIEQFGGNGFGLCAIERGIATCACTIDSILHSLSSLATDRAFGGVGLDAEQS